jgi:hypothetical protein
MTYDQLAELGFIRQTDGSYSKPPQIVVGRISHSISQRPTRAALDNAQLGKEKGQERIVLRIVRKSPRLLDADNFAGGCKPLIDQVRYAGLIPDDSPDKVEIVFVQEKVKKGEEGTLIEIIGQILDCLD